MAREVTVRVQFATAHVGDATSSLFVRGSLPELGGCLMRRNGAMCTHDFVIQRVYEPGQTIQFEYYYEARDADGQRVWVSRSSRCRLTMDTLLNHTMDSACGHSGHTKLVLQATGVAAADPDAHVLATGSGFDLGNWDLKRAKKLRRTDKADRHHASLFLTKGTSHAYTVFLVQNSDRLFGRDSVPSSGSLDGAEVVWNSGVGVVELGLNDNACVVLLDRWDDSTSVVAAAEPPAPCVDPHVDLTTLQAKTPEELLVMQQELIDKLKCKVCWEKQVQTVLVPCGHCCACWECGFKLQTCPLCRAAVNSRMRVFL